jgi:hypothetical protein
LSAFCLWFVCVVLCLCSGWTRKEPSYPMLRQLHPPAPSKPPCPQVCVIHRWCVRVCVCCGTRQHALPHTPPAIRRYALPHATRHAPHAPHHCAFATFPLSRSLPLHLGTRLHARACAFLLLPARGGPSISRPPWNSPVAVDAHHGEDVGVRLCACVYVSLCDCARVCTG